MKHTKVCLYIPCGARLDLLHAVKSACKLHFGSDVNVPIVSQHAGGSQTKRTVVTYALVMITPDHPLKSVPSHHETNKIRAHTWEALRLRCMDTNCTYRPVVVAGPAATPPEPDFKDDAEAEADGDTLAIDEAEMGEEAALLDVGDVTKKVKADPKDVFCSAKPLEYYKKVLTGILGLSTGRLVVVTKTAHPGLPVAARLQGLEVLLCVEDCPVHSKRHGEEVTMDFWRQLKRKEAEDATVPQEIKSVTNQDLTFMTVMAPEKEKQLIQAIPPARNLKECGGWPFSSRGRGGPGPCHQHQNKHFTFDSTLGEDSVAPVSGHVGAIN